MKVDAGYNCIVMMLGKESSHHDDTVTFRACMMRSCNYPTWPRELNDYPLSAVCIFLLDIFGAIQAMFHIWRPSLCPYT